VVALLGCLAATASAATFTVGTASDTAPGTSCTPSSGTCSLRELIEFENGLSGTPSPIDTIVVPAGSYNLTQGQLLVSQSVNIAGAGARGTVITQQTTSPTSRVFEFGVCPGGATSCATTTVPPTVSLSGVQLQAGQADSSNGFFGGDVLNEATVTLNDDEIEGGETTNGSGAGISNEGGSLTVDRSLIAGNGTATTNDSGGIQNHGPNPITGTPGTLVVSDSTITGNTSAQGGGIFSWCASTGGCSSTGAANTTQIIDSTIVGNDGGTRTGSGGGLRVANGTTMSVENSIVAGNTVDTPGAGAASNCGTDGTAGDAITSLGHNIDSGPDCGFTASGDLSNTDPGLLSTVPQNVGGPSDVLPLAPSSPAVDAVPAGSPGCSGADQRGVPRPQGPACDIGAYELVQIGATATPITAIAGTAFGGSVATVTDQFPGATASDLTASISWGDGTTSVATTSGANGTFMITGIHTWAAAGSFTMTVTVTSAQGSVAHATETVTVHAVGSPTVALSRPTVLGDAKAAFAGTVNPQGLATTAHFEYGLDPRYTGAPTVDYDNMTAAKQVGNDFTTHAISSQVSGLLPNALYHVRLVAINSAGTTTGPDETFTTNSAPAPPLPTLAKTANVVPVSGVVLIKPPPGGSLDALGPLAEISKGVGFVPLTQARQIPVGSRIDARRGTLRLVARTGLARHTQSVRLSGGLFTVAQSKAKITKGLTTFTLNSGGFSGAPSYRGCPVFGKRPFAKGSKKPPATVIQTLHATDHHGKFKVHGRFSAGTVRGTDFTTTERCDGTLTTVHRGTVDVLNYRTRKTIAVRAGHFYLAVAAVRKKKAGKPHK
jgi:hypothetical protein